VTVGVVHYSLLFANDCDFVVHSIHYSGLCRPFVMCGVYSCSNAYVKRKPGWLFSVSEAPDPVSRVHVDLACNGPLVVVDDQYNRPMLQCKTRSTAWTIRTPQVFGLGKKV